MRRQFRFVWTGLFIFALALSLGGSASAPAPASVAPSKSTIAAAMRSGTGPPWSAAIQASSLALSVKLTAAATAAASEPSPASTSTTAGSKDVCLDCHGAFDELAKSTADYLAPSGEKGSPHRYVPHEAKDASAIPGCGNCHQPHPVPPTSPMMVPKANLDWCYGTCHHENNFSPCKNCHQ